MASWTLSADAGGAGLDKAAVRKRMRQMRLVADQKQGPEAALDVLRHGINGADAIGIGAGSVVAGYWPIATELDVRPLLARLGERGAVCCLPVIGADQALLFRRWQPGEAVEEGPRGTCHPSPGAPVLDPDIVFAPMLAVDDAGRRLGQGGGYYDRTLAALRARRPVVAIAVGYAVQRVARLPAEAFDQPMDWVLTDAGLTRLPVAATPGAPA